MCGVCGCGETGEGASAEHSHEHTHADGRAHSHAHSHDHGHEHEHEHEHEHHHMHEGGHTHSHGPTRPAGELRWVKVERDILEKNNRFAAVNRRLFQATHTLAVNLVSSPGAGKTSLLVRALRDLATESALPLSVIEGDQQTDLDAARIRETGIPALQINTGKMCHLDASMIAEALGQLPPPPKGILFIENVGNLVCPAGFDLGEAFKVALVSVTEGEDKPLKYPDMFRAARLVLVTKTDLLPHLEFDVAALEANARRVNPEATVLRISARSGEGLAAFYAWLRARLAEVGTT